MTEPAHIRKAKAQLLELINTRTQKRTGRITLSEIFDAEQAVTDAEADLEAYQQSDSNLRQAIDQQGVVSVVVEKTRGEHLETLRATVQRRYQELAAVKRQWLAGSLEG